MLPLPRHNDEGAMLPEFQRIFPLGLGDCEAVGRFGLRKYTRDATPLRLFNHMALVACAL